MTRLQIYILGLRFSYVPRTRAALNCEHDVKNAIFHLTDENKYQWVPRHVWSGVPGTGNPNMKIVLVQNPVAETYHLPFLKHRNLLTLCSGPGTQNGVQILTPRNIWGR